MFGFLKDKLKNALGKFSKDAAKEAEVEKKEIVVEEQIEQKKIEVVEEKPAEKKIETTDKTFEHEEKHKKGFFQKIFGKREDTTAEEKEELIEKLEGRDVERIEDINPLPLISHTETLPKEKYEKQKTEKYTEPKVAIPEHPKIVESSKSQTEPIQKISSPKLAPKIEPQKITPKVEIKVEKTKEIEAKTSVQIQYKEAVKQEHVQKTEAAQKFEQKNDIINEQQKSEPLHISHKKEDPNMHVYHETVSPKTIETKSVHIENIKTEEAEKKGFFTRITETFTKFNMSEEKFEELFWELELVLLENSVAVEVIDKIKQDMKKELMSEKISRKGVEEIIISRLRQSVKELFDVEKINLLDRIKNSKTKPYVITIIGVNGSGKTTSIAKLTNLLQKKGLSVVLAASDTFRAAAIQQLEEHANNLGTKLIKHDYNSDPAAVGFDAVNYAKAKNIDVVIIDTAGRLHNNANLMEELRKVIRVCKPDIKIFVGESITGNDCVEQAKEFDKVVGIDAIILAKADIDDKGGAAISISYVLHRPILYIGTGQKYEDLKDFNPELVLQSLEL